jgi:phosphatidylglycerol:prolipoprotein diacylglycerol transferase
VPTAILTGIPYTPFPYLQLGPVRLMTFGLFVAVGVIAGIYVAARRNERFGIARSETEKVGLILIGLGFVGARLLWVITHPEEINSVLDVFAVWNGGLQFSGGFITAILLAPLVTRRWPKDRRWELLDGAVLGLAIGQAIGRLGCYAVGEHLGGPTDFFLGITYQGGTVVEGPLIVGQTYHSTALYEILFLIPIIIILLIQDRMGTRPGIMAGTFAVTYAVGRFSTDFLRVNDERVFGLTGAQYMTAVLFFFGLWVLWRAMRRPVAPVDTSDVGNTPSAPAAGEGESKA